MARAASGALAELRRAYHGLDSIESFYSQADRTQHELFEALNRAYAHEVFAKLFALKLTNLAVARRLFATKEAAVASRPIQLMLDPANNCQLHCPGCVHTSTENHDKFDWPGGILTSDLYAHYIDSLGPFAFAAVLYNYGEPLLNVNTPDFIRTAKSYLLSTMTSTNLLLVRDPDDLVKSGLDYLIASIDGTTQATYEQYRRGGDIESCFANLRALIEAKRRLNRRTPYIVWQYLTFEHNVHEVDRALTMAAQLGVNELLVATPFDVGFDDPSIRAVSSPKAGRYVLHGSPTRMHDIADVPRRSTTVDRLFEAPWASRAPAGAVGADAASASEWTCSWLYQSMTIDANGRVTPCCGAPSIGLHNYIYGNLQDPGNRDWFNSERYMLSRLAYRNRPAYEQTLASLPPIAAVDSPDRPAERGRRRLPLFDQGRAPYCASCTRVPAPTYDIANGVPMDVHSIDPLRVVPRSDVVFWANWHDQRSATRLGRAWRASRARVPTMWRASSARIKAYMNSLDH
jgi:MoaA/NifB/PqqE/SkfB family radical SAM enzyme